MRTAPIPHPPTDFFFYKDMDEFVSLSSTQSYCGYYIGAKLIVEHLLHP